MPRVRLYGPARDAFGCTECQLAGTTPDELLAALAARAGADGAALVARSRLWVNGEPAPAGLALHDDDEVALVPPVSGGAA